MTTRVYRGVTYTVETLTGNDQTFQGTQGNDWLEAPGSNNVISTGKGNDVITVNTSTHSALHSPARLEIADTEERESRICRTQLLQKSVKVSLTA
ncbi:hypothetical protein [Nostoc sp.]|uniref:hypothetical protein n=1 Tax=Nostoc sp. TaxID=1180 RepID=UPI002FF4A026